MLSVTLRPGAKEARLTERIHRAIPYPVFLIRSQHAGLSLSLAHLRWSQGQSGQTVLDGSLVTATVDPEIPTTIAFLASLNVTGQPRQHLRALYQGWIEKFEAYAAARLTGSFAPPADAAAAERRRTALAEHERLTRGIASLRARADKETQLNRLVDINLTVQHQESQLANLALSL